MRTASSSASHFDRRGGYTQCRAAHAHAEVRLGGRRCRRRREAFISIVNNGATMLRSRGYRHGRFVYRGIASAVG